MMPPTPEQLYAAGRLDQAEAACRVQIARSPAEPGALHLLGVILCRQKKFDEGLPYLAESVALRPHLADYRVNYALALNEAQRWSDSEPILRSVLSDVPDHPLALLNLGNSLHSQGRSLDAIPLYRRALEIQPTFHEARVNLAIALKAIGKIDQASNELQSALVSEPQHTEALYEHARMLADQKRYQESEQAFRRLISIDPSHHRAIYCLGIVLSDQGKWQEAAEAYSQVVRLCPEQPEAYQAMAVTLRYCNRITESIIALEKALQLKPDFILGMQSYGSVLTEAGRIEEGIEVWRRSLEIEPKHANIRSNVAYTLSMVDEVSRADLWREHQAWGQHHCQQQAIRFQRRADRKKIRLGYISPDLRLHSVCYFLIPLLQNHDKERFEVYCYSDVSNPDSTTAAIRRLSDQWREILGKPNEEVRQLIQQDQIDILIDLAGHTMGNRMELFGHKSAPIQISWLGYPETTGLPTVDYKIADRIVYPEQQDGQYSSEETLRLPSGFHCYMAPPGCPEVANPPAQRNGFVTFGSFSSLAKLTPRTVALWSDVLKQVPDSKLMIKARQLADSTVRDRYVSMFAACGIPKTRLRLELAIAETIQHLDFYREIDIVLDTFPYNGTTTLCEGLWMGVPPVSLCGQVPASRVGASLLNQLDLGDWVAHTAEEFVGIAKSKSQDIEALGLLRTQMRDRFSRSSLGSPKRFAMEFESALEDVWKKFVLNYID